MTEPALAQTPPADALASLRRAGAQRLDPVRFHYLEVLFGRLPSQPEAVQRVLRAKFDAALAHYQEQLAQAGQTAPDGALTPRQTEAQATHGTGLASLVALNGYLHGLAQTHTDHGLQGAGQSGEGHSDMKSVRHFKKAWSRGRAQDQVALAVQQGPDNAGPLNSHRLVLRSLSLMRHLSPDYLQRFLAHTESLLWLDKLSLKQAPAAIKPARRSRRKV